MAKALHVPAQNAAKKSSAKKGFKPGKQALKGKKIGGKKTLVKLAIDRRLKNNDLTMDPIETPSSPQCDERW